MTNNSDCCGIVKSETDPTGNIEEQAQQVEWKVGLA